MALAAARWQQPCLKGPASPASDPWPGHKRFFQRLVGAAGAPREGGVDARLPCCPAAQLGQGIGMVISAAAGIGGLGAWRVRCRGETAHLCVGVKRCGRGS
jgi:hypothetical protein